MTKITMTVNGKSVSGEVEGRKAAQAHLELRQRLSPSSEPLPHRGLRGARVGLRRGGGARQHHLERRAEEDLRAALDPHTALVWLAEDDLGLPRPGLRRALDRDGDGGLSLLGGRAPGRPRVL